MAEKDRTQRNLGAVKKGILLISAFDTRMECYPHFYNESRVSLVLARSLVQGSFGASPSPSEPLSSSFPDMSVRVSFLGRSYAYRLGSGLSFAEAKRSGYALLLLLFFLPKMRYLLPTINRWRHQSSTFTQLTMTGDIRSAASDEL